ncbi:MAG: SDR family oxidoreductase [Gammaproteobacteria bacterium]|nr:SDR family oxidoreductase [Gammaproteobacteria bacterium]
MDLQLKGKTALITGSSQGIGRAIAKSLAAEGVQTAIAARREPLLQQVADTIDAAGHPRPIVIAHDLMSEDGPESLGTKAIEALGSIDILINSAGGTRKVDLYADAATWDEGMNMNFNTQRRLSHTLLPQMIERQWGRIITISGKNEPEKHPGKINVAMSAKAAIHAWSKGLSNEVSQHGVTVNCLGPGKILSEQIRQNYTEERRRQYAEEEIPIGYIGEPEDMAAVATFLCSPLARYITGVLIPVDGSFRKYAF